jgi:hypothetical protein
MTNNELLLELEQHAQATEQCLALIAGALAAQTDPKQVLMLLVSGMNATQEQFGANDWRKRMLRWPLRIVALKARQQHPNDLALQTQISILLADWYPEAPTN